MENQFDAVLTGSDSQIEGVVTQITHDAQPAYQFTSLDDSLHIVIMKDTHGHWIRVAGTEPYFSGWVDELAEQITYM